jgi:hypothetical protein
MKTTVEISDPLLDEARKIAAHEDTTLHALVEQGLRKVVSERRGGDAPFTLRDASVGGKGIRPELAEAGWSAIRRLAYGSAEGGRSG